MSSSRRPTSSSSSRNDGAMVRYDEEKAYYSNQKPKQSNPNSQRPKSSTTNGRPQQRSQQQRPRPPPPPVDDDDMSAISEQEHDPNDEPQFKYSTAALADDGWRGNNCCVISMVILCVIVAIILSVVMVKVFTKQDEENQAPPPTMAPTTSAQANMTGLGMFQSPQSVIDETSCTASTANTDTCRTACAGFDCCDPTVPDSCFFHNQKGCLNYKRCHVTMNSGVGVPPTTLEQICSPESIAANPSSCQNACASVACCWESNVTCYDKIYTCLDYSHCQNLRSIVTVPAASFQVTEFCDPTKAGSLSQTTACQDACQPAECCWNDDPTINCLQTDFIACMTYEPCGLLEYPPVGDIVTLPPPSIREDCSIVKLNTGNTTACQAACETGSCCFGTSTSSDTCFMNDPLSCLAYEPCHALTDASTE